jgi:hypothetical protein
MNDESLARVNAFLAAVVERTEVGEVLQVTPAEIGRELGFPDALSTARAVRALTSRRRLQPAMGSYRLLDATPVDASEREAIERAPRRRRLSPAPPPADLDSARYSDLGHAAVDRLIQLGGEVGELRASASQAREELREARRARDAAEQEAQMYAARARDLQARAEMAESNLRSLLATAKTPGSSSDAVSDSEMEAILGVLKGGDDGEGNGSPLTAPTPIRPEEPTEDEPSQD